jgi:hypothetical protein
MATSDEFGIPWCDEQQRPILNGKGQEQFDSLSSHGANFNGNYPDGQAEVGPDLNGHRTGWALPGERVCSCRLSRSGVGMDGK